MVCPPEQHPMRPLVRHLVRPLERLPVHRLLDGPVLQLLDLIRKHLNQYPHRVVREARIAVLPRLLTPWHQDQVYHQEKVKQGPKVAIQNQ